MTANITFTADGVSVTIAVIKVEEVLSNQLSSLNPPQGNAKRLNGPQNTLIVNLQRIQRRWNIDGYLSNDINNASTDKTNLITIYINGGSVTMDYTSPATTGIIEKMMITEVATDSVSSVSAAPQTYEVKLTFLKGALFPSS